MTCEFEPYVFCGANAKECQVFRAHQKDGAHPTLAFQETGERFDIPIRTLFRWQNKLEPCTTRNKPATKINMEALAEDVEMYPDAYQWERAKRLGVAHRTVGDALKRLAISRKKNTQTSKS